MISYRARGVSTPSAARKFWPRNARERVMAATVGYQPTNLFTVLIKFKRAGLGKLRAAHLSRYYPTRARPGSQLAAVLAFR